MPRSIWQAALLWQLPHCRCHAMTCPCLQLPMRGSICSQAAAARHSDMRGQSAHRVRLEQRSAQAGLARGPALRGLRDVACCGNAQRLLPAQPYLQWLQAACVGTLGVSQSAPAHVHTIGCYLAYGRVAVVLSVHEDDMNARRRQVGYARCEERRCTRAQPQASSDLWRPRARRAQAARRRAGSARHARAAREVAGRSASRGTAARPRAHVRRSRHCARACAHRRRR
jgi:uncharacterized membrane protein YecN with MAPEG domain